MILNFTLLRTILLRSKELHKLTTFPALFSRMDIERIDDEVSVPTTSSNTSTSTSTSIYEKMLDEYLDITSKTNNNLNLIVKNEPSMTKKFSSLKECHIYVESFASIKGDNNNKKYTYSKEGIPDYFIMETETHICVQSFSEFIYLFLCNKRQKKSNSEQTKMSFSENQTEYIVGDEFSKRLSESVKCQYRTTFSCLNFMADKEIIKSSYIKRIKGEDVEEGNSSIVTDCDFFSLLLSKYGKLLVFTTKYGDRFTALETLQKYPISIHKVSDGSSRNLLQIISVEELSRIQVTPESMFHFPYSNIILDCMHLWTISDCTTVFKALTLNLKKNNTNMNNTRLWLLSNSNTVKNYGYDIIRDFSIFRDSLMSKIQESSSNIKTNSSAKKQQIISLSKLELRTDFNSVAEIMRNIF